jgi:hypothetical protein
MSEEQTVKIPKKRGRKPKAKKTSETDTESNTNSVNSSTNSSKVTINKDGSVRKKRGRKPKPKPLNEEPKVPKKRGRKPKVKSLTDKSEPKVVKRRGRKPKEQSYGILSNMDTFKKENDNIIIHLPIKSEAIKNNNKEQEFLNYNPNIAEPVGYQENIMGSNVENCQFISQKENEMENGLLGAGVTPMPGMASYPFDEKQQNIIDILENQSASSSDNEEISNKNEIAKTEFNVNHEKDWFSEHDKQYLDNHKGVDKIMDYIKKQREEDLDNLSSRQPKKSIEKCMKQFDECNKTKSWASSTSIYCWWCCHPFNGPPCGLPNEYKNETFYVDGIFCSPECAAAWNFGDTNSSYDLWERYSLLNYLYRKVYNDNSVKIKLASARPCLKIFGGSQTIKEFRQNNTNYKNTYKIVMPPMISIIPVQEISEIENGYSSKGDNNNKVYMINKDKISDSSELKLKRKTPYNKNSNTLEKCMKISTNNSSHSYDSRSNYSN